MGALVLAALNDLAGALVHAFPPPTVVADGSWQGNVRPGLLPCPECKTPQRPGAVHFARLTDIRPCVGSWRRR